MSGLHKFLICVLSVVVAVSLGVTVYYFARNNSSTISLSKTECYQNVGEQFEISIKNEKSNKEVPELKSSDETIVEFVSKSTDGLTYTFLAKSAGDATVNLVSDDNLSCKVKIGDGTSAYPYFVRNKDDLLSINTKGVDKCYQQIENIDMNGVAFTPIAPTQAQAFSGTYLGTYLNNSYSINNLKLEGNITNAGMFGYIAEYAKVQGVTLNNVNFKANSQYLGGIAAENNGSVVDCAVSGSLETTNASGYVGGVVALNNQLAKVMTSSFNGSIANGEVLGGVVAENFKARVSDCYARGEFKPSDTSKMGGVVCYNHASSNYRSNVANTYSTMKNTKQTNAHVGMILYENINYDGTQGLTNTETKANRVYGNHYATTQNYSGIYGVADNNDFTAKITTPAAKVTYSTYGQNGSAVTWDFNNIWNLKQSVNDSYPTLRFAASAYVADIYIPGTVTPSPEIIVVDSSVITTREQLAALMNETDGYSLSKNYSLGADIDMTGVNWTAKTLNGSLDGKDEVSGAIHTVSNLTVTGTDGNGIGVFARINGMLANINFTNLTIQGSAQYLGLIAGENAGVINNVTADGEYTATNDTVYTAGGLVGINSEKIENSAVTVNYDLARASFLGGLAGENNGTIDSSTFNGSLETEGQGYVGGLVGNNTAVLQYSTANINSIASGKSVIGGLVGQSTGNIRTSFANVAETAYENIRGLKIGGLVGSLNNGTVDVCGINANAKLCGTNVAGLASIMNGGSIKNSYTYARLYGTAQSAGMVNEWANNAVIEKNYIACPFASNAQGQKYESNTNFRASVDASNDEQYVKDNVINEGVMGIHCTQDSRRNYPRNYTARHTGGFIGSLVGTSIREANTPHDNLRESEACSGTDEFADNGWDVSANSIWNYGNGGPVLKSIAELKAKLG